MAEEFRRKVRKPGIWRDDKCPLQVELIALMPNGDVVSLGMETYLPEVRVTGTVADFSHYQIGYEQSSSPPADG